ncbi:MAG TPA: hypothetical protein VF194_12950 [Ferrovibrio sp.]|uniref:hypothetical protein n=1 Tax=Ferrovibrio sp. TaxID=1917215 RepID=UPI002ED568B3
MKQALIVTFSAALLLAAPAAFANHCPMDMAAIDAALPNANLTADQKAEVTQLRAEGEALHKAGRHEQSMMKLDQAKKILNIK